MSPAVSVRACRPEGIVETDVAMLTQGKLCSSDSIFPDFSEKMIASFNVVSHIGMMEQQGSSTGQPLRSQTTSPKTPASKLICKVFSVSGRANDCGMPVRSHAEADNGKRELHFSHDRFQASGNAFIKPVKSFSRKGFL